MVSISSPPAEITAWHLNIYSCGEQLWGSYFCCRIVSLWGRRSGREEASYNIFSSSLCPHLLHWNFISIYFIWSAFILLLLYVLQSLSPSLPSYRPSFPPTTPPILTFFIPSCLHLHPPVSYHSSSYASPRPPPPPPTLLPPSSPFSSVSRRPPPPPLLPALPLLLLRFSHLPPPLLPALLLRFSPPSSCHLVVQESGAGDTTTVFPWRPPHIWDAPANTTLYHLWTGTHISFFFQFFSRFFFV